MLRTRRTGCHREAGPFVLLPWPSLPRQPPHRQAAGLLVAQHLLRPRSQVHFPPPFAQAHCTPAEDLMFISSHGQLLQVHSCRLSVLPKRRRRNPGSKPHGLRSWSRKGVRPRLPGRHQWRLFKQFYVTLHNGRAEYSDGVLLSISQTTERVPRQSSGLPMSARRPSAPCWPASATRSRRSRATHRGRSRSSRQGGSRGRSAIASHHPYYVCLLLASHNLMALPPMDLTFSFSVRSCLHSTVKHYTIYM